MATARAVVSILLVAGAAHASQAGSEAGSLSANVVAAEFGLPSVSSDPLVDLVASPRPLLIYIPFHVTELEDHVAEFCDCTLKWQPWHAGSEPTPFDVLLSISGPASAGHEVKLKAMLESAVAHVRPRPRVFVDFIPLTSDRYVQDVGAAEKDADWVSGPNTAFYDAMLDGRVYHRFVKHYRFVQQMETDVCALRDGWLDVLLAPMLVDDDLVVSGATIRSDCVYYKAWDRCDSVRVVISHSPHMYLHVNGNALYRVGAELASLLSQARLLFKNTEPFDLAMYWAAKALDMESLLHSNPAYYNLATHVDASWCNHEDYYGGHAGIVHVPRRLRTCALQAVASRGQRKAPLTIIVVDEAVSSAVMSLVESLKANAIEEYGLLTTSQDAFVQLSRLFPLRVIPAFDRRQGQARALTNVNVLPSNARNHQTCDPWPPPGTAHQRVYAVLARLVRAGYAPFVVDQHAFVFRNYGASLARLPNDSVYVSEATLQRQATRPGAVAHWRPALMYLPPTSSVASFVDAVGALAERSATTDELLSRGAAVKPLPMDLFTASGPMHDLSYPLALKQRRLVYATNARTGLAEFNLLQARARLPASKVACTNYTMALRPAVDVHTVNVAHMVHAVLDAASFASAHSVACLVLPILTHRRRSAASVFAIVDYDFLSARAGAAKLLPGINSVDTGTSHFVDCASRSAHQRTGKGAKQGAPKALCDSAGTQCLSSQMRSVLAAAQSLVGNTFLCTGAGSGGERWPHAIVNTQNVVLRDLTRPDVLAPRLPPGIVKPVKIFMRGMWRALPPAVVTNASSSVATFTSLTHLRRELGCAHVDRASPFGGLPVGREDNLACDDAWADVVESAVCATAHTTQPVLLDTKRAPNITSTPLLLSGAPFETADRDLAQFKIWLKRYDRRQLGGPFLVYALSVDGARVSQSAWSRAAKTALLLARATGAGHVVVPGGSGCESETVHREFSDMLPPTVAALVQPELAALVGGNVAQPHDPRQDASIARKYSHELAVLQRLRWRSGGVPALWSVNVTDHVAVLLHGFRAHDWVLVVGNAETDAMIRKLAAASGGDAYVGRVDAFFDVLGYRCGRQSQFGDERGVTV